MIDNSINGKALAVIDRLLGNGYISPGEAEILLAAIPAQADSSGAEQIRRDIVTIMDFAGLSFRGRPHFGRITGKNIVSGGAIVRDLERNFRLYWHDHKCNSAEMGRLIAVLNIRGVISVPVGGIGATAKYFAKLTGSVNKWNIACVRRGYSDVIGNTDVIAAAMIRKEATRWEAICKKK